MVDRSCRRKAACSPSEVAEAFRSLRRMSSQKHSGDQARRFHRLRALVQRRPRRPLAGLFRRRLGRNGKYLNGCGNDPGQPALYFVGELGHIHHRG
jgi:hypothetical protein